MNLIPVRAYCGETVYESYVSPTEEGVEEFRDAVIDQIGQDNVRSSRLLISIPGGKA